MIRLLEPCQRTESKNFWTKYNPMSDELLIIGAGPAGLTAGMYAARARIRVRAFEGGMPGGQVNSTAMVENYPGISNIVGAELAQKLADHAVQFGLELSYCRVERLAKTDNGFKAITESGKEYTGKDMIIATGAMPVKLGIPGEEKLTGKGVSYCAVCDGPFNDGKEVAVIGGGDSAVEEAVYLTRYASKVHVIHRRDELRATKEIQEKAFAEPKVEFHWSHTPVEILGEHGVEAIRIRSVKDGNEKDLSVFSVFFYVGLKPTPLEGIVELAETDPQGFIITDINMLCSTPGLFAAGDMRSKTLRQISTAVGDGAVAAFSAQHYLEGLK